VNNDKLIVLKYLSILIEIHWIFICVYRNRGVRLINQGCPLSSKKLLWYDRHLKRLNRLVLNWQRQYRSLYEIKKLVNDQQLDDV
jgi:hypothetical protein